MTTSSIQTWERAEIARSSVEATLTPNTSLRVGARHFARYVNPPANTPYALEYAYHLLGDVRGLRIIDFGCGSGGNAVQLANRGAHVWAVDISEDLIRIAKRRMSVNGLDGGAQFIVGSAHDLPFPDGSLDIVFGIAILHHLNLKLVSREVHRVLRPGGRAIFQEPVRNSAVIRFLRALIPYKAPDISPYERPLTDAELRDFGLLFSSVSSRGFNLPFVPLSELVTRYRSGAYVYKLDRAILDTFPALQYYAGIRVLEVVK
jgi:SAM-dependent methyltransferase